MIKAEKVLIMGSSGLLGSSLAPYLKKCGHEVVTHGFSNKADFIFDLCDKRLSLSQFNKIKPNVIINLVSLTNVDQCEQNIKNAYIKNTLSVENIGYWIRSYGESCHLIQISTDHVYDGVGLHPEENTEITNNYALTKYAGELAALNMPSTILRTNFVGHSKVLHRESLTDWAYKALISNPKIEVFDDVFFSPLSIKYLIEMIDLVVQRRPLGIYNLGSNDGMSKADLIFTFADCLNLPKNLITAISADKASFLKTYRPKGMLMDSAKFEETLNVRLPNLGDLIKKIAKEYDEIT